MKKLVVNSEFPVGSLTDCLLDGDKEIAEMISEEVQSIFDKKNIDDPSIELIGNTYKEIASIMECAIYVRRPKVEIEEIVSAVVVDALKKEANE